VSWLSLVGIGEDGVAGLGETARARIAEAEFVFGGNRHLDLVAGLATGIPEPWQSPIALSVDRIAQLSGRKVCVLASGDPFWFGIGATLVRTLPPADMQVFPAPSAFSLAAARLGWPLQDIFAVSAHGRPVSTIVPHLSPGARLLVLTSDGDGPVAIGRLLTESGFGDSALTVLEALGGPHERIVTTTAQDVSGRFADLNLVAIAVRAAPDARILGLAPGRDDSLFAHDGQISKGWARALTLAALSPRAGELLWDIGAGSGSVGIEWLLAGRDLRAVAIEADPVRAARIAENAERFGVQHLTVGHRPRPRGAVRSRRARCRLRRRRRQRARRHGRRHRRARAGRPAGRQCGHARNGSRAARPSCKAGRHARALHSRRRRSCRNHDRLAPRHAAHPMALAQAGGGVMTVHFIGAGPGAPDLITVRGRDLIARCPVCLYAGSIVPKAMLDWCPPGARLVDTAPLSLDAIVAECVAPPKRGRTSRGCIRAISHCGAR
jgi:precorrin-6Y C5,15-methyltransferase (decarboxylating)